MGGCNECHLKWFDSLLYIHLWLPTLLMMWCLWWLYIIKIYKIYIIKSVYIPEKEDRWLLPVSRCGMWVCSQMGDYSLQYISYYSPVRQHNQETGVASHHRESFRLKHDDDLMFIMGFIPVVKPPLGWRFRRSLPRFAECWECASTARLGDINPPSALLSRDLLPSAIARSATHQHFFNTIYSTIVEKY